MKCDVFLVMVNGWLVLCFSRIYDNERLQRKTAEENFMNTKFMLRSINDDARIMVMINL